MLRRAELGGKEPRPGEAGMGRGLAGRGRELAGTDMGLDDLLEEGHWADHLQLHQAAI